MYIYIYIYLFCKIRHSQKIIFLFVVTEKVKLLSKINHLGRQKNQAHARKPLYSIPEKYIIRIQ